MKTCSKCKENKSLESFRKSKAKTDTDGYTKVCKECYKKAYGGKYTQVVTEEQRIRYRAAGRMWYQKNKQYHVEYNKKNREKINAYVRVKRATNIEFAAKEKLRHLLNSMFKYKHTKRNSKTEAALGFTYSEFAERFEIIIQLFKMNNIKYQIDHCIPLAWFKTDVPPSVACHLDNLRIVTQRENHEKGYYYATETPKSFLELAKPWIKPEYLCW